MLVPINLRWEFSLGAFLDIGARAFMLPREVASILVLACPAGG